MEASPLSETPVENEEESVGKSQQLQNSEHEFISLLIDLYRDCPELWRVKSKDYFNRNKKSAAFEKIVRALKALKPDYTVNELKKKINVLRTNFNREHKAIERQKVSGASTDDIPEPSLWYYKELSFIKDQIEVAPTETSEQPLSDDDPQSQFASQSEESLSNKAAPPSLNEQALPLPPKKKRKVQSDSTEQLVGLATEYFKRPESEEDILAKGWAIKLKRLLPDQRRFAEKIINDTLFEAESGNLTRDGLRFEMYPRWSPSPTSSSSSPNFFNYSSHNMQRYPNSAPQVYSSPLPSPTSAHQQQYQETSQNANAADFFFIFHLNVK